MTSSSRFVTICMLRVKHFCSQAIGITSFRIADERITCIKADEPQRLFVSKWLILTLTQVNLTLTHVNIQIEAGQW